MSGLGGAWYHQAARESGLRWISPDKPGYGGSGYQPGRSLLGWAEDLAALAGHLGLDRFALAGESGGGPLTLAAAHRLAGGRVCAVALIASSARLRSRAEREGQQATVPTTRTCRSAAPGASPPRSRTPPCTSAIRQTTMSAGIAPARSHPCWPRTWDRPPGSDQGRPGGGPDVMR